MSFTLLGLTESCTAENGQWISLALIRAEEILVMPTVDDVETLIPNADWSIFPVDENIKVSLGAESNSQGVLHTMRVELAEPSMRPLVSAALQRLMGGNFVAALQGDDEAWSIFGTNQSPMRTLPGSNVAAERDGDNESTLVLDATNQVRPLLLPDWAPNTGNQPAQLLFTYEQQSATSWFFTIAGSTLADGSPVTGSTTGLSITYVISRFGTTFYSGTIEPGENASLSASWSILAGSRNSTQFAAEWSSQCAGTGIAFTWNPAVLAAIFGDSYVDITVSLSDGGGSSATYTFQVPLN